MGITESESTIYTGLPPIPDGPRRAQPAAAPQVVTREFNRGWFDRSDPLEAAGTNLEGFSFAETYRVDPSRSDAVVRQLFENVEGRLRRQSVPGARVRVVDYHDARFGKQEKPRRYVVVSGETRRATHVDIFATFRRRGDYVYVSVNSFMLPPANVLRILLAFALSLAFLRFAWSVFRYVGQPGFGLLVGCGVLLWHFRDVVRSLNHGDSLGMALRRRYHTGHHLGTFNTDDVLSFFKSAASLIVEAITEVFEQNGIPTGSLAVVQQTINQSTNITNTGGGVLSILGNIVGGTGNRVTSRRT